MELANEPTQSGRRGRAKRLRRFFRRAFPTIGLIASLGGCSTGAGDWESWDDAKAGLIGAEYNYLIECAGPPLSEHGTGGNSGNVQYVGQYSNDAATTTCRLSIDVTGGRIVRITDYVDINGMPTSGKAYRYTCTRIVQFCARTAK